MTWLGLIRGYRNKEVLEESTCIYISSLGISLISGNTSGIDRAGFDEKFRLCKMVIISSSTSMGLIFDFNMSCHFILADNNNNCYNHVLNYGQVRNFDSSFHNKRWRRTMWWNPITEQYNNK